MISSESDNTHKITSVNIMLRWVIAIFLLKFTFIISRSSRKSGPLLCLRHLCWFGFPALFIWSSLHSSEGCQRAGFWTENISETAKRIYGRPLWGWHLRLIILLPPHTISLHNRRLRSISFDCRTGSAWSGTDEKCVRWHLATSWLQPLFHS